jgi:hypothetical protein
MATIKKSAPVATARPTNINAGKKAAPSGNMLMKKGGKAMKKGGKMC